MKRSEKIIREILDDGITKQEYGPTCSLVESEFYRYQFDLMVNGGLIERVDDGSRPDFVIWNPTWLGHDFYNRQGQFRAAGE